MSRAHEGNVLATYRSLRLATVPLLLVLVVATLLETMRGQVCVLGSISAYFHTPVRGAFVFALAGLGACLIAYKGNDSVEDVLLNFAGFMAFLVALVPTEVDTTCPAKYGNVVPDANSAEAVRNNVLTLVIVSVVACAVYFLVSTVVAAAKKRRRIPVTAPAPASGNAKGFSKLARFLAVVAGLVVVSQLVLFGFWPSTFLNVAHWISAVTMVLGVLGVMVANAWGLDRATQEPGDRPIRPWTNRYAVVAATTLTLAVATALLMHNSPHLVLVIELIVIGGFVVFWFLQTRELWDYPSREEKSQMVDQVLEAVRGGWELDPVEVEAEVAASRPVSMLSRVAQTPAPAAAPVGRLSRKDVFNAL
jgi:hypothetical protein